MRYNRAAVAGGLLVGIITVTVLLRAKFYFDPPPAGAVPPITQYLSDSLIASIEPPFSTNTNLIDLEGIPSDSNQLAPTISVTPTLNTAAALTAGAKYDLVTGLQPTVVRFGDNYLLGFLSEQRYVVKVYDPAWQPLAADDITLTDDLKLIAGQLPLTKLAVIGDKLMLLYTRPREDDVTKLEMRLKQFTAPGEMASELTLLNNLPSTAASAVALNETMIAVIQSPLAAAPELKLFSINGQLLATLTLSQLNNIRALIPDQTGVIVVSTQAVTSTTAASSTTTAKPSATVTFTKISRLGKIEQTVNVNLPEATAVIKVDRINNLIALHTASEIILLAKNLQERFPSISLNPEQLQPQLTALDSQIILTFTTATSLTDYLIHAVVQLPDAATDYIN